uniref:Uncharacterized protein n=1 Tax=Rhizophora mucronata TaxID=61149 RepID=A0A2P2QFV3_RHIMU
MQITNTCVWRGQPLRMQSQKIKNKNTTAYHL